VRYPLAASALLALAVPAAIAAAERQVTIAEVRIEGPQQVHPDRIRFVTSVRAGRAYTERDLALSLADDVRAITRMGPFADPRTEVVYGDDPATVTVVIRVTELPYVVSLDFDGLDEAGWGADGDLRKRLATRPGGYANPLILDNDLRAVERFFRDKGHRGATARLIQQAAPGGVALAIAIDLPPAVKVGRVIYRNLPDDMRRRRLDNALDATQVNRPGRPWQPELLALDQGDVVRAVQDEGWLDAALRGVEIERTDFIRPLDERRRNGPEFAPDGVYDDRVHLIYDLDPGERYRLGSVSFVGNGVASSEELRAAFEVEDGAWYRRQDIGRGIERARRVISNRGFARCRVAQERRVDLTTRIVHLTLRFDEGRPYTVGRVDIRGNVDTRDGVVRRALALHPGELWNDDKVEESRRQIARTGLFSDNPARPLSLRPVFPPERPDEADLVIDLDESSTGSLQAQVGYSSSAGLFGQLGFTERNIDVAGLLTDPLGRWRGGGQVLEASVDWAGTRNSLSLGISDPALADGPYSMGVSASRTDSSQRDWDEVRLSGEINLGRRLWRNDLRLGLSYGYTDIEVDEVDLDAPDDAREGSYFYNSIGVTATWDRLNNPRLPTSGGLLSAGTTLEGDLLPATESVLEYTLKGDGFLPLLESDDGGITFIHLGARWRHAIPVGGTTRVPFYDRYLGGGPAPRHRGFGFNRLSPRSINANGFEAREGGDRDLMATLELSYPFQGYNEGVSGVLFTDAGNVWSEDEAAGVSDIRIAYGFGIRFPLAFPISLDFAWLAAPREGESSTEVHFGLGQIRF
jgi:outer membrane protein assembly complex protein YaeT